MASEVIAELKAALPENRVFDGKANRLAYSRDWSPRPATDIALPDVVVVPRTVEEVAKIVQIAHKHNVPVVPVGGLTGMGGSGMVKHGGILIDTKGLNKILEIDKENFTVTTQAGITIWELNQRLKQDELWMPHEPESKKASTVGAAIACSNDSTFAIKYGKMVEHLLDVTIVNGEGKILRFGHRKAGISSAGYRLEQLMINTEGTLGIIVEATLRTVPLPEAREIRMWAMPSLHSAMRAIQMLLAKGILLESANINCKKRLGFYTHTYMEKYGHPPDVPDWAQGLLALTFGGDPHVIRFSADYSDKYVQELGGYPIKEQEIIDSWWASKYTLKFEKFKQKWPDSQQHKKFGAADLGIPFGQVEVAYKRFLEITERLGLEILGMNVYLQKPNSTATSVSFAVFIDDQNPRELEAWRQYIQEMGKLAIELEGTHATYIGEAGPDYKRTMLLHEAGPETFPYYRKIRQVFDPKEIMNPGTKFDERGGDS